MKRDLLYAAGMCCLRKAKGTGIQRKIAALLSTTQQKLMDEGMKDHASLKAMISTAHHKPSSSTH